MTSAIVLTVTPDSDCRNDRNALNFAREITYGPQCALHRWWKTKIVQALPFVCANRSAARTYFSMVTSFIDFLIAGTVLTA